MATQQQHRNPPPLGGIEERRGEASRKLKALGPLPHPEGRDSATCAVVERYNDALDAIVALGYSTVAARGMVHRMLTEGDGLALAVAAEVMG